MKIVLFFILLVLQTNSYSAESKNILIEKEGEFINFDSIKNVLRNDHLEDSVSTKLEIIKQVKKKRRIKKVERYNIPSESEFWNFMSEYWIVKNAPILKWNFQKPNYGIKTSFTTFLEKMGFLEVKFKILLLDSPNITHFSLPSSSSEFILLLSVPFIRRLNLSRQEISLVLFEDFVRHQMDLFKNDIMTKEIKSFIGSNVYKTKKINNILIKNILRKYDKKIYEDGYNFQQQFKITKKVSSYLKSDPELLLVYKNVIKKIDALVKTDLSYKDYIRIYPSPELQLDWLTPKKKVIY